VCHVDVASTVANGVISWRNTAGSKTSDPMFVIPQH